MTTATWVLVVEDDDDNRDLVVEILNGAGYETQSASSGAQALKILQTQKPCLIVADLMMSEMDGRELLVRARELLDDAMPPFVFLTGVQPSWLADIRNTILTKPIEMKQLLDVVARHCGA
jgi:CheY-like chemotaxis protein